mgnify:CR=1 FL=1
MVYVIKRLKNKEEFNASKIEIAIKKAFLSCNKGIDKKHFDKIMQRVLSSIEILGQEEINIETIQDIIEETLMRFCYYDVAKNYMLYREDHNKSRYIKERIDYMEYYSNSSENAATSSETDANANVAIKNVANMEGEVYKNTNREVQRQRMKGKLNKLYPEVAKKYEEDLNNHIIYAHDESQTPALKAYCMAATLYPMMLEGTGNIDGVTPDEPNDISSFSGQVTNLVFLLSSQVRGAVALGDYFVALNFYVIKEYGENWYDKLNVIITSDHCNYQRTIRDAIRKGMKQFIYGVNQPAGNRSYNSPFSNINFFDKYYYNALFKEFYYPDGTKPEWKAIDKLQRIFMELLRELRLIKPLTFPVTSLCMLHDNNDCLDLETKKWAAEEWAKGSSFFMYLSNNPNSISSCCRVQNEIVDNTFNSTTGLTGIMTGSANVITLNLNRIIQNAIREYAMEHGEDESKYRYWGNDAKEAIFDKLNEILDRVYKYQIAYKTMLYEMEEKKMYSCCNAGYIYMSKLYCTIGVIGYCEAAKYLGLNINDNEQYKDFLKFIFSIIQEGNKTYSIHDGKRPFIFNLEAIPGENLAVKLYEWDKKDGYKVPDDQVCFSSYFFRQWDDKLSVLDKLKLHNKEVNQYCGGGQACHIHLDEHLSEEQYTKLINFAVHEGCNYFTFNIPMSECKDCKHVVNAPVHECPVCGSKNIDWWVRIIGFLRPISAFSKTRQIEASKRVYSKTIE